MGPTSASLPGQRPRNPSGEFWTDCGVRLELLEHLARRVPAVAADWLLEKLWSHCRLTALEPVLNPDDPSHRPLSGFQQAAIVLMSLPPVVSAEVFRILGIDLVQSITKTITSLALVGSKRRAWVLEDLLDIGAGECERLSTVDPGEVAELLRDLLAGE